MCVSIITEPKTGDIFSQMWGVYTYLLTDIYYFKIEHNLDLGFESPVTRLPEMGQESQLQGITRVIPGNNR